MPVGFRICESGTINLGRCQAFKTLWRNMSVKFDLKVGKYLRHFSAEGHQIKPFLIKTFTLYIEVFSPLVLLPGPLGSKALMLGITGANEYYIPAC